MALDMVLYEVNIELKSDMPGDSSTAANIEKDYLLWLGTHIQEILELPGFTGAKLFQVQDKPFTYCVQYELDTQESLAQYLKEHAPKLRQDALTKWGSKFNAERRVLIEMNPGE